MRNPAYSLDSVIMTRNLATIRETEIDRAIGSLPYLAEGNDV